MHGIRSKTGWYNALYAVLKPLFPVARYFFPGAVTTTELWQDGAYVLALVTTDVTGRTTRAERVVEIAR